MFMRRDFYMAASRQIQGLDMIPVVEVWIVASESAILNACVAMARPVGFAVLTADKGYWLAHPADLSDLAHAINCCLSDTQAS